MANLDLYRSTLKPYIGSIYQQIINARPDSTYVKLMPYDHTQFDPEFSVNLMDHYNRTMNLGLTDQQIADGIKAFAERSAKQWNMPKPLAADSNPVAVAAESIERALALAGKATEAVNFWDVASKDLGKGQTLAEQMTQYQMSKTAQEYLPNSDDGSSGFLDKVVNVVKKVAPIGFGIIPGIGGVLMGAAHGALSSAAQKNSFDNLLKDAGIGAIGGLVGQGISGNLGGLFGDTGGVIAEQAAAPVVDATINSVGNAAGAGGSMFDLSDIVDLWDSVGLDGDSSWLADQSFGNYDWPSLGGGETGILGSGGGYTGISGTIDGIGSLSTDGLLTPIAGGAAVPLSSLSSSVWSDIINKAASDPLSTAGKLAKAVGIFKTDGSINPSVLTGLLSVGGGYLAGNAAQDAAKTSAQAQLEAARIAADAAKFKPVGVTTRFGQSQFTKDAQGNVTSAGYTMPQDIKAMQDSLIGAAPGMLSQFTGSQATTAPMGTAAQRMMGLGNQYLAADPQAQAQKFYDQQQALMATNRARQEAGALTGEFNRGTYGLATGGTGMMNPANPRMEALYNAQRQQDLQAAYDATKGGQQYATFGSGLVGAGGDMLQNMYRTQSASYDPYKTAMGGAQMIEGLGQNALDLSVNMGKVASPAQSGQLLANGMLGSAQTMQPSNAYSPWGTALMNAGNALSSMSQPQQNQQYQFNPFTGVRL